MKKKEFDSFISEIRNEQVDDSVVAQAGDRVWKTISGESSSELSSHSLRTCGDFQSLIPDYLAKRIAPARALLLQDHVHDCVACRRALDAARTGDMRVSRPVAARVSARRSSVWNWTLAASAAAAMLVVAFSWRDGTLPGQHAVRGEVQSVNGSLFAVSGEDVRVIPAGYTIRNGDQIRTAKASSAVLRLSDGSLVEVGERAGLSVSRAWKGTTIHLEGGQVIVQAAKQGRGHLYVATDDYLVSVKGTIFSVNHGMKGSRVAVIEGVVRVDNGSSSSDVTAGQEATSNASVSKVPIQNEIAWSKDSAKYLALLGDFAILQKQFAAIPAPGLRYSSDLLPYVPDNTVIYAAIPNLSNTLSEAGSIFHDRLEQSPALRDWWRQQQKGSGPKIEDVFKELATFSSYLGDEIVFADSKSSGDYSAPIILARVRQPGLEAFLQTESSKLNANSNSNHSDSRPALQIVHDLSSVKTGANEPLLVYLSDDLLIASPKAAELQAAVMRSKQGSGSHFADTPFYQQIAQAYHQGAGWLFCANMEQIFVQNVHADSDREQLMGMRDVQFLTMQHREVGGRPDNRAAVSFASERHGVASWLSAPASMGSLEFVSPDASMATSVVIKNPRSILEELFHAIGGSDPNFDQGLADFESKTGVRVLDDMAAPLGGEVTMAFDGPIIPTPRWKLVFEVYDPATLQSTIAKLIDGFNREGKDGTLQLTQKQVGSQTYYAILNSKQPSVEIHYTFVDSYLIVAPDTATISRAMQIRQTGYTLQHSNTFRALLPDDGYTNFSAIFYHNIGPVVGPVAEQLKASGALTPQQRQSIDALTANSAPGLIYAYGEPDRIVVASNTGFMGFDLGTLLMMGNKGPFMPQMMLGGAVRGPVQQIQ